MARVACVGAPAVAEFLHATTLPVRTAPTGARIGPAPLSSRPLCAFPLFLVQRTAEGILRVGLADPARIEAALDALFGRPTVNVLVADATKLSAEDRAKRDETIKGWADLCKRLAKAVPPPPPTTLDDATRYGPCAHSPPLPALHRPSHLTFVPSWGLSRLLAWCL